MRPDLRHAGAIEHHQPQREEAGDTKGQDGDGDFHFNFSKMPAAFAGNQCAGTVPGVDIGAVTAPGAAAGVKVVGADAASGTGACAGAFAGMTSFCPTLILVVVRLLADWMALTLTPNFLWRLSSVSPALTV